VRTAVWIWIRRWHLSDPRNKQLIERWQREEKFREAEIGYLTDRARRSPEWWWEQICSDLFSLPDFLARVKRGMWVTRRASYWQSVTDEVLRQAKNRAVNDRVKDLQELQNIRAALYDLIMPRDINGVRTFKVRPSSLEGMVNAFVRLDALADDKRDRVLSMIEPEMGTDVEQSSAMLTPDEYREMARHILIKRMKQIEGEPNAEKAVSKTDTETEGK